MNTTVNELVSRQIKKIEVTLADKRERQARLADELADVNRSVAVLETQWNDLLKFVCDNPRPPVYSIAEGA